MNNAVNHVRHGQFLIYCFYIDRLFVLIVWLGSNVVLKNISLIWRRLSTSHCSLPHCMVENLVKKTRYGRSPILWLTHIPEGRHLYRSKKSHLVFPLSSFKPGFNAPVFPTLHRVDSDIYPIKRPKINDNLIKYVVGHLRLLACPFYWMMDALIKEFSSILSWLFLEFWRVHSTEWWTP